MNKVNIFRYSRGSNLNVAIFGWLLDFAKYGGELQEIGIQMIREILGDENLEIKEIKPLSMYKNIALVAEINDDYLISVEDITFAKNKCSMLKKHREILMTDPKYLDRKKKFVYINIGNKMKSNHRDGENCVRVTRYHLLKLLCKYEGPTMSLIDEYKDYLIYIDKMTHSHAWEDNFEAWHRLSWEGYFDKFKEKDSNSDWENISSQKGDSIILLWNRVVKEYRIDENKTQKYAVYATIETELPCRYNYNVNKYKPFMHIKVEVLEGRYKSDIRNYVWNIIEEEKKKYENNGFYIEKTSHAIGTHMTIGRVENINDKKILTDYIEKIENLLKEFDKLAQ